MVAMNSIYSYYDYHKYLDDFYRERKAQDSNFSFRYIALKVGIDHALIVKVFQGKRHLGIRSIAAFAKLMGLNKRKSEYFELLVHYGKAKHNHEIKHYFEKILGFSDIDEKKIDADYYEFYQKWYYTAVREVINLKSFKDDYEWLSGVVVPTITPAEAKKAVKLLTRMGFIKLNTQGFYSLATPFITSGASWQSIAIRNFQKECAALAIQALDTIPKEDRDISTVTLTLNDEGFSRIRESVSRFQRELIEIAATCSDVNRAYQVNVHLFPISKSVRLVEKGGV